jgi:hypothetical protein
MAQRKTEGTAGGGEELEDGMESDIGAGIRYDGQAGQGSKPESEGATATGDVENDAEFGSKEEERNGRHAIRPTEGQGTSMHADGPQQGSDGDGRMIRTGGEHEKDDDGESPEKKDGKRRPAGRLTTEPEWSRKERREPRRKRARRETVRPNQTRPDLGVGRLVDTGSWLEQRGDPRRTLHTYPGGVGSYETM